MESLRKAVYREFPEAKVVDIVSKKTGSFEVSVNGKLAFSHLKTCIYPDCEAVVRVLQDAQEGKKFPVVTESHSKCTIV